MIPHEIFDQIGPPITRNEPIGFSCLQCGDCCRCRDINPVMLTGYDVYQLTAALGKRTSLDLINNGTIIITPERNTLMPICTLSTTTDGSCVLLTGNHCSVHKTKPAVCALYPFGRLYDGPEDKYIYVRSPGNFCLGCTVPSHTTLTYASWLEQSGAAQAEPYHAAYERVFAKCVNSFLEITNIKYMQKAYYRIAWALFGNYTPNKPFLPQLDDNLNILQPFFEKAIKKK